MEKKSILMKNFTISNGDINGMSVSFATDETGADWYASQKNFQADTLKIVFNSEGVIVSMSHDVSALWPGGNSVAEIPASEVPGNMDIEGNWMFDGKSVVPRTYTTDEWQTRAEQQRQSLITAANIATADWRTELKLDIISDEDKDSLIKWMAYIKAVKALDISALKDEAGYDTIAWPKQPS